jgi:predicted DNA-binding transcriptional regulator YafY
MPDINRYEKIQTMIRLALAIGARRMGVTTEEARGMLAELGESAASLRTAQRAMNGLAAAFPGFHKDDVTGRWVWPAEEIPAAVLSANPRVWPDLKQAAQIMADRGDTLAALRIDTLSQQVAAQNMNDKQKRDKREAVIRALETEALLYRPGPQPLFEAETLETVRYALRKGRKLVFVYENARGERAQRIAVPYGVLLAEIAYMVGPSDGKENPALWRLDRMHEPVLSEESCQVPDGFNLQNYADRSFGAYQGEEDVAVTLHVAPEFASEAEFHLFHNSQTITWDEDGSLRVHLYGRGLQELALQLLPWGGKLVIEGPPELRDAVRAAGEQVARMVG